MVENFRATWRVLRAQIMENSLSRREKFDEYYKQLNTWLVIAAEKLLF